MPREDSETVVSIEKLSYSYPPIRAGEEGLRALSGVSLSLRRGEFVSIMGPTGAGKTTLCLAMNGIVPHSTGGLFGGEVVVCGMDTRRSEVSALALKVGIVFQDPESQLFSMTVEDEVAFGLENLGVPKAEMRERVRYALDVVGMGAMGGRSPFHLSGGQKQRVAIAAMLAMEPEVLILDEPTSGLDPLGKQEVFSVVDGLRRTRNMTIVMVEQESEKIAEFSDRVIVLEGGRVVASGKPREVFGQVEEMREIGISIPQVREVAHIVNGRLGTDFDFLTMDEARLRLAGDCLAGGERLCETRMI
jgi:energy-coupling factor transporter ATP-binding protein EcfA2